MQEDEYNDEISEDDIDNLIARAQQAESKNIELASALQMSNQEQRDENFLHHQISTEKMLDKLEHFYRGDYQGKDSEGNVVWKKQKNKDLVTFNEYGVTSLMEIITKYIDKNTILSYYTAQRIYEILADIGEELVLFILSNYKQIGMDTYFKKTKFRIIITTTLHIIESTYRRALDGETMERINESKVVGQFGSIPRIGRERSRGGIIPGIFKNR